MANQLEFLIIDGYPKADRDELKGTGMKPAWKLYGEMLQTYLPEAKYDVLLPSDFGVTMPDAEKLKIYTGILWTGCSLSINDTENPSVRNQIKLAETAYEIGIPSFGTCWGLQMAVVAAGGKVELNPNGREMCLARKILLSKEGRNHPMYKDKPDVFEGFTSHYDMVTELPPGAVRLSGNDWTYVQSAVVTHKKGTFWAAQYHPEYNLYEMACLLKARVKTLIELGFYKDEKDAENMINRLKELAQKPDRKDLRWQLAIDDDILDRDIRQYEFRNWIDNMILGKNA